MAAKKKAVSKKKPGTGIATSWQQQLAKHAKTGKAPKEKPLTGDYISADGSKMVFTASGGVKLGSEINCVVLGWCFENVWHDYNYISGEAYPPSCFAIGYDEDELTADPSSPIIQGGANHGCIDCELNEWGSGIGKGKACGNRRRLALVVDAEKGNPQIKILSLSPTSLNNWKAFIEDIENFGIHIMQAAITIGFDTDSTAQQAPITFDFVEEIENETVLEELSGQLDKVATMLEKPNDVSGYVGDGSKPKGKKASKKKASKKKVATKKKSSKKKSKFSRR